jgi:hypothetical protein
MVDLPYIISLLCKSHAAFHGHVRAWFVSDVAAVLRLGVSIGH